MRVNLGTLLLDQSIVQIDQNLSQDMEKTRKKDYVQCENAWHKKFKGEQAKRGMYEHEDGSWKKRQKIDLKSYMGHDSEEIVVENKQTNAGKVDDPVAVVSSDIIVVPDGTEPLEENEEKGCEHCDETPCVWLAQKEDMERFDESEHGHLPEQDMPPNNIRRKKVYRQMFLYINEGPSGKGVRIQLPKCVEIGARKMFPSPSFMGFKEE